MTYISYTIEAKNRINGWENETASLLAEMDLNHYMNIITGEAKPNYEDAQKLSKLYKIPASFFLSEATTAIHMNFAEGTYSNSNHGYIHTLTNNTDSILKELVKELISVIKPDIVWPENESSIDK